jgi:hypothetical protein
MHTLNLTRIVDRDGSAVPLRFALPKLRRPLFGRIALCVICLLTALAVVTFAAAPQAASPTTQHVVVAARQGQFLRAISGRMFVAKFAGQEEIISLGGLALDATAAGIDAFGERSPGSLWLTDFLLGEEVEVTLMPGLDPGAPKQYWVSRLPERHCVNTELVRQGKARLLEPRAPGTHELGLHEDRARKSGKGIWQSRRPHSQVPALGGGGASRKINVFVSKIESVSDDIVKLQNGAVISFKSPVPALSGSRKSAVLYGSNEIWHVAIEGKRTYACSVLKNPTLRSSVAGESVTITRISSDGDLVVLDDGRVFEVDSYDTYDTSYWLTPVDALLIDGSSIVNLDDPTEPIEVSEP